MSEETEDFLQHYGVRGQKWGVRRALSSRGKTGSAPRPSDEGRAAGKILSKQKAYGTSSLTNHELRIINSRAKLELEFQKNFPKPLTKSKKGQKFVKEILSYAKTADEAYSFVNKVKDRRDKTKLDAYNKKVEQGKKLMQFLTTP